MSSERHSNTAPNLYVWCVIVAGAAAISDSLYQLTVSPIPNQWLILAALTLLSGSFTVKVPKVASSISVSETFVVISVLVFGPSAATLTVALEALVISLWILRDFREVRRVFFNMGASAFSIWTASQLFYFLLGQPTISGLSVVSFEFLFALIIFISCYFLLNSMTVAIAVASNSTTPTLTIWKENFAWLSLNYFGGASVAVLLVQYTRDITITAVGLIVPFLLITYLTFKAAMGRVEDANRHLFQLNRLHLSTIETLAMAIDAKDQITHGHIRRVQLYAVGLAKAIGIGDVDQIKAIEAAALLHDMGKLAVPEHILNKPGKLTPAEFEKMKAHATVGADILAAIEFPYPVVPIVRHHHECWTGQGYPDGLIGTAIPIGARVLSVVDCYDALTSDRPYRPRLSDDEAIAILRERRGTMYDPMIVDTFLSVFQTLSAEIGPSVAPTTPSVAQSRALNQIAKASVNQDAEPSERFDDTSASTDELLALYDLSKSLSTPIALADVGDVIAKHVRRMIPASLCVFFVYDPADDVLVVGHASGAGEPLVQHLRLSLGTGPSGWVAANRQTILNSPAELDLGDLATLIAPRLRNAISTPLIYDKKLIGVITLYSEFTGVFSINHKRILEVVAAQIAPLISSSSDFDHHRRRKMSDALTGLPNEEYLRSVIDDVPEKLVGLNEPLSLLYIHLQGLQEVYDGLGTEMGDLSVTRLVGLVRRTLRGADLLFRRGISDLVVLLTHTDAQTAMRVAERIRRAAIEAPPVTQHAINIVASSGLVICCGVASSPLDGTSLDQLITLAKERLAPSGAAIVTRIDQRAHRLMN